jgi:nitrogen-specific signal transduction histidine kinase/CheY-like chemotaxis protein
MDVRPRIVEYDGKPATMLVMRNVTERKHLEEQLILAQKMEAVGQLAGGIAHDFNNLLSAVIGFAQLANLQLETRGTVESSHLDEIQQAAERGAQLTRQLLAFSRRQVTEPKVLNLNDLIVNLDRMLRRLIGEHVELITLTAAELGAVRVDLGQMEQVLTNLVVNARDAMGEGGTLTIRTENVDLDDESARIDPELEPGKYVRVTVSDNGLGMKPDVAAHIFEPFFTTKGVGEGTGLGLSTCYGIVKQNGGHIAVESELNEGTTFKIFLPRLAETPEVLQADDSERAEGPLTGSETVLLVEDEPAVRKLTSEVLQNQGYRVLEATNGVEAVGVMEDDPGHRIDLLVTDVVMPAMGGRELAQRFRTSRPDGKVLYMSGYPDSMISRQGDVNLDGGFLQKPVTMVELARKVREMLDH